jgi:hypothetical protein
LDQRELVRQILGEVVSGGEQACRVHGKYCAAQLSANGMVAIPIMSSDAGKLSIRYQLIARDVFDVVHLIRSAYSPITTGPTFARALPLPGR